MQMPVFLILFLAPVYVPLALLAGWVHAVAKVNPFTALIEGGRDLISGQSFDAWLAYGIAFALAAASPSGRAGRGGAEAARGLTAKVRRVRRGHGVRRSHRRNRLRASCRNGQSRSAGSTNSAGTLPSRS